MGECRVNCRKEPLSTATTAKPERSEKRKAIAAETDDDREWIPSSKQKCVIPNVQVTAEMIQGWQSFLDEAAELLAGKQLVPHRRLTNIEAGPTTKTETRNRLNTLFQGQFIGFLSVGAERTNATNGTRGTNGIEAYPRLMCLLAPALLVSSARKVRLNFLRGRKNPQVRYSLTRYIGLTIDGQISSRG